MIRFVLTFFTILFAVTGFCSDSNKQQKPNVLFIAIDDLNDWIEPLGVHPQAKTPNLDKFCQSAMLFDNAVCAAPICCPSRSAILSGFMPQTTGVYGNGTNMLYSPVVMEHATLPEYFTQHGYYTLSNGKVFHKHGSKIGTDFGHWAFNEHARARRYVPNNADPKFVTSSGSGIINGEMKPEYKAKAKLRWGPTKCDFEGMVDTKVARWGSEKLNQKWEQPFFMALGFIKPHLPWFVPKEFFDMYGLDTLITPDLYEKDLDDIRTPEEKKAFKPSPEYLWVKKHGLEKEATRAYLASTTFVDRCVGIVLEALDKSGLADNTIVVIWGDHGYHLGEKQRYMKNTTWNEAVKMPFIVKLPNMKEALHCERTVSLIDIYPTLIELCGLPQKELDGTDFSHLLKNPKGKWEHPGITVSANGTSVMGERFHFCQQLTQLVDFQ